MTPEELEATREGANVDYAPDIAYEDWQAMARALLAHIDSQAVTINNLAAALDALVEERAQVLAGKGNLLWDPLPKEDRPDGLYPAKIVRGKTYWRNLARKQLAHEMPEAFQ